ncbi:MAG TPA: mevalonate kinase [Haliangiales bacterium]|nr:mevalonate kinase [Haliangiales bacterium]
MRGLGKVILLGEHAVVYGHPALAGALARGVAVTATGAAADRVRVAAWGLDAAGDHPAAIALGRIRAALGTARPVEVVGETDLPARAGLGSSAALSVAIARALAPRAGDAAIERAAQEGEKVFHHNPSGVDVALATRGGLGVYRRGAGLLPIAARPFRIAVGLTGEPRDTGARVAQVAALRERDPAATDGRLAALGELAVAGRDALDEPGRLGPLLDEAQRHLAALGLSSPGIDRLVALARGAGALGAKLTGAGGGGAVLALAPGREDDVIAAWGGGMVVDVGYVP